MPELINAWLARLPEAPPYFPADQFTDQPERFLAAEIIREKAILATREEVPYAIAVLIDSFEETENLIRMRATLYVEREGQKGILIGKRGETMKKIGTAGRARNSSRSSASRFSSNSSSKFSRNWRENPNRQTARLASQLEQMSEIQEQEDPTQEKPPEECQNSEKRKKRPASDFDGAIPSARILR